MKKVTEIRQLVRSLLDKKLPPRAVAIIMFAMLIINAYALFGTHN
jgi:hypothetical protein